MPRSAPPPRTVRTRTIIAILAIACAVLLAVIAIRGKSPGAAPAGAAVEPPVFANLAASEPAVRAVMQEAIGEVRRSPRDARAWSRLAMVYEAYLVLDLARQCYEQAILLDERDPKSWFHLAMMRVELGDVPGGIEAMGRSIALKSDYAPAHWRLGFLQLDMGDLDAAERSFRRAMEADRADPTSALGLARVQLQRGNGAEASAILERALASSSSNSPYAWQLLASAYRRQGRFDDAATAMQRGRGGQASLIDAWQYEVAQFRKDKAWTREHARLLADQSRTGEALALIEPLARQQPGDVELLVALGGVQRQAGQLEAAVTTLRRAVEIDPSRAAGHFELALALYDASRAPAASSQTPEPLRDRSIADALTHLDRSLGINPRQLDALSLKGQIHLQTSSFDESTSAYQQAAAIDPGNPAWPFRAALAQMAGGRWENAIAILEPVTREWPDFAEAWRGLGVAQMKLGRFPAARESLQKALALRPDDPKNRAALRELEAAIAKDGQ